MGTAEYRGMSASDAPLIKSFGTFTVVNNGNQSKITLSQHLEHEPFPIDSGAEIKVEQVNPNDGEVFLKLTPVSE